MSVMDPDTGSAEARQAASPVCGQTRIIGVRDDGDFLPLEDYGVLGDGRTIAASGADGSIDWWCVPHLDSPPLFDRLLNASEGGYFSVMPDDDFTVERAYLPDSNVLATTFTTSTGRVRLIESLNSGPAGRLPWAELGRRIEGVEGVVPMTVHLRFSRRADTVNPYFSRAGKHDVFHAGRVLGLFLSDDGVTIEHQDDAGLRATVRVQAGVHHVVAIVAGEDEPLVVPTCEDISARIDSSHQEWRQWTTLLRYDGPHRDLLIRNALVLKLLLFSPSGAIAAAGTTSLPERLGGNKNYDYRYAWVRDAGYTIKAFLRIGAQGEAKAAFSWLLKQLAEHDAQVFYALKGGLAPDLRKIDVPGYRHSRPVVVGNIVARQHQHGIYGDIFETASRFVSAGNILDARSAEVLSRLADQCADEWRWKDSGIWELPELEHYTMSKISAWQALARAVELADDGQLPTTCRDRWTRERDRIQDWIETHCWSDTLDAFEFFPGSGQLDASLALAVRFRFNSEERLRKTIDAIDRELSAGPFHHRYHAARPEEGCFLACTFWMIEARALLGQQEQAEQAFERVVAALDRGVGVYAEMVDPDTGAYLGNLPQGLTHLAMIQAITTLSGVAL